MLLVGLTGGIGAGKSTVADMLAERGAVVIDADELAREALEPGTPGSDAVVREFGARVVGPDGRLDRSRLASIVFADEEARRTLEAIVHPEVARRFREEVDRYRDTDRVVVYAVPLLVENRLQDAFDVIVVVAAGREARMARLTGRGMDESDVARRMDAQITDDEREAVATFVIRNDGSIDELRRSVDRLWIELRSPS